MQKQQRHGSGGNDGNGDGCESNGDSDGGS
jgi:hypothetical protein